MPYTNSGRLLPLVADSVESILCTFSCTRCLPLGTSRFGSQLGWLNLVEPNGTSATRRQAGAEAPIHDNSGPRHEGCVIARQEDRRAPHFLRPADAPQRMQFSGGGA